MAIYRDIADWVGPTGNRTPHGMGNAYGVVLHIQEGNEAGTEAWQRNPASQVSSHFMAPKTGRPRQMVDTVDKAWCEVAGNTHWWSVEIEGHSGDSLTAAQVESCAQVLARAHRDEAVPLAASNNPNAATDAEGGLGYHAMGGNAWGGHFDCPGAPIVAARTQIIARAKQIATGQPAPAPVESDDDMPTIGLLTMPTRPGDKVTHTVGPANSGAAGLGPAYLSIRIDPKNGGLRYRVAVGTDTAYTKVWGDTAATVVVLDATHPMWSYPMATGERVVSVDCLPGSAYDATTVTMCVEYGRRP